MRGCCTPHPQRPWYCDRKGSKCCFSSHALAVRAPGVRHAQRRNNAECYHHRVHGTGLSSERPVRRRDTVHMEGKHSYCTPAEAQLVAHPLYKSIQISVTVASRRVRGLRLRYACLWMGGGPVASCPTLPFQGPIPRFTKGQGGARQVPPRCSAHSPIHACMYPTTSLVGVSNISPGSRNAAFVHLPSGRGILDGTALGCRLGQVGKGVNRTPTSRTKGGIRRITVGVVMTGVMY